MLMMVDRVQLSCENVQAVRIKLCLGIWGVAERENLKKNWKILEA